MLEYTIKECLTQGTMAKITVFGEYENEYYTGKITRIDPQLGRIKIEEKDEIEWLRVTDILWIETLYDW